MRYQLAGGRKFLAVGTLSGASTLLTVGTDHIWILCLVYALAEPVTFQRDDWSICRQYM